MTDKEIIKLAEELGDENPNFEFYRTHTVEEIKEALIAIDE